MNEFIPGPDMERYNLLNAIESENLNAEDINYPEEGDDSPSDYDEPDLEEED